MVYYVVFFAEKVLFQTVVIIWHHDKRGYTEQYDVCCTTTWTLGENIWKIVFIWARTFLLPIKQPSSYNLSASFPFTISTFLQAFFEFTFQCNEGSPFCADYFTFVVPVCGWHWITKHPVKRSWAVLRSHERQPFKCNGLIEFVKSPMLTSPPPSPTGRRQTTAPFAFSPSLVVYWRVISLRCDLYCHVGRY